MLNKKTGELITGNSNLYTKQGICPGCGSVIPSPHKVYVCINPDCGYECPETGFPSIKDLLTKDITKEEANWNNVNIFTLIQHVIFIHLNLSITHDW